MASYQGSEYGAASTYAAPRTTAARAASEVTSEPDGRGLSARASSTTSTTATSGQSSSTSPREPYASTSSRHGVASETNRRACPSWSNACEPATTYDGTSTRAAPATPSSTGRHPDLLRHNAYRIAGANSTNVSLTPTAAPSSTPASSDRRGTSSSAPSPSATASRSTCAPTSSRPSSTGLSSHSQAPRDPPRRRSSTPTASHDARQASCHSQTVRRRLSPPTRLVRAWTPVATGPYRLGVRVHGSSTALVTGSRPPAHDTGGTTYGSPPCTAIRP